MRDIKFRAWHKELNIMDYGNGELAGYQEFDCSALKAVNDIINQNYPELIWMQYTGENDIKGKRIYEGDIVTCLGDKCEIKFSNGTFGLRVKLCFLPLYIVIDNDIEIEVIGNIYENPELLEE